MSKFKKGDKVRVVTGHNKGEVGIVTNPYWQIAANDWPFVLYVQEDGTRGSADDSDLELIEDPTCEYSVKFTLLDGTVLPIDSWGTRDSADRRIEYREKMYSDRKYTMKLVKRKKAGEIEDV